MSEQITLSDVRKWTDGRVGRMETAIDCIVACKENERPLGLIQHLRNMYAILQKAPKDCVQELDNEGWRETTSLAGCRPLRYAYRLHPDVELIDDTAPESEYEFVEIVRERDNWELHEWGDGVYGLTSAPNIRRYICTKVEDADGQIGYVDAWAGPYGCYYAWDTIEGFCADNSSAEFRPVWPLTPKAVVFRQRPHDTIKRGKAQARWAD